MQKAKLFARFLSMPLALFLVLSVGSPIARAAEKKEPTPIIYIIGRTPIYKHLSDPERRAQVPDAGGDAITDAVKEALPYVAKAVFLGQ
ncbi:MAG: hypothetical protein IJL25_05595, partial [Clostridia bacterium]|nr:hypothetical protein [Clostridia bacterium]